MKTGKVVSNVGRRVLYDTPSSQSSMLENMALVTRTINRIRSAVLKLGLHGGRAALGISFRRCNEETCVFSYLRIWSWRRPECLSGFATLTTGSLVSGLRNRRLCVVAMSMMSNLDSRGRNRHVECGSFSAQIQQRRV